MTKVKYYIILFTESCADCLKGRYISSFEYGSHAVQYIQVLIILWKSANVYSSRFLLGRFKIGL